MEIKLTEAQKAVIDDRGGELLVSAAAGSGKTKVLVDRVIGMIAEGASIDDFLIITYTKAAAAELRVKLQKALQNAALEKRSGNFRQQLIHFNLAHISTVHSFSENLLKEYAMYLRIPSDFRIGDEQECRILKDRAMGRALEFCYQSGSEVFSAFSECFSSGRNDRRLAEIIETVYEKSQTRISPDRWLDSCLSMLEIGGNKDLGDTPYGAYLIDAFKEKVKNAETAYLKMKEAVSEDEIVSKAFTSAFDKDIDSFRNYLGCSSWDELHELGDFVFARANRLPKDYESDFAEEIRGFRDGIKKGLKESYAVFKCSGKEHFEDISLSRDILAGAVEACRRFAKEYGLEKERKHILDFSDLEHQTLRLLYGSESTEPNREAKIISSRFREVLVDEYQDSNSIQDAIFRGVTDNGRNLFMVGDVKQSIYRFRLAEPRIFLGKYEHFADYRSAAVDEARKILLSDNFRSVSGVLSAVNDVMRRAMHRSTGGLEYSDAESLRPGLQEQELIRDPVELRLLDGDSLPDYDKVRDEAAWTASIIRKMISEGKTVREGNGLRACRFGDFAILIRSPKNTAAVFEDALKALNVPVFCDNSDNIMESDELRILSQFVEVLVNPRKDIPLAGILLSPLFCFSAEELARYRGEHRNCDFYDCLKTAGDEKAKEFLNLLQELRSIAAADGISTALSCFIEKTNAIHVFRVLPGGKERIANVAAFQSMLSAQELNGASPENLVEYIVRLREKGIDRSRSQDNDSVLITSIHKSKGLEYPIVILPLLSKGFNLEDSKEPILFDSELGIASNAMDPQKRYSYPSIQKLAISKKEKAETVSEELRILYVAMTRARDRLLMLYSEKNLATHLKTLYLRERYGSEEACSGAARSLGDWILMEALHRAESVPVFSPFIRQENCSLSAQPWDVKIDMLPEALPVYQSSPEENVSEIDYGEILRKLEYRYPYDRLSGIPSKLAATQLKGSRLDGEIMENAEHLYKQKKREFSSSLLSDERRPDEIGTAVHAAIQYLDYRKCDSPEQVRQELDRLAEKHFLSPEQRNAVIPEQIYSFVKSDLGKRILSADRVIREFKFSVMRPASMLYSDAGDDKLMIQGVADCILIEGETLSVIDYKTDRVSPENEQLRAEDYRAQVEFYASALSDVFHLAVKDKIIYFIKNGNAVFL